MENIWELWESLLDSKVKSISSEMLKADQLDKKWKSSLAPLDVAKEISGIK